MSNKALVINALWDEDAGVWVATSDDVPGLVTEASTFEELDRNVRDLVPDLLRLNNTISAAAEAIPIELIARRHKTVCVPAK